jgi:aspartate/methionine/tyrosine aminotransferase
MKFSSRLSSQTERNTLTLRLEEKRREGVSIFDLTESNPTHAGIVYPEGFLNALADPRGLHYEPEPFGLPAARELIAREYGSPVVMTASTSEAYSWLFKLLCNPGDEVLIPRPSYPLFDYLAALESVTTRHYGLFYDHGVWCIDFHTIIRAVNDRTRAIIVVNPNNPTGHLIARNELQELRNICAGRGISVISDEVFRDYLLAPRTEGILTLGDSDTALTFTLHGLSKAVGLPQMKLAWMVVSGEDKLVQEAMGRLELIADTYLSAGTPVQCALPALLALREPIQNQILARLRENLEHLRAAELRILEVEAGWYATVLHPHGDDFAEHLLRNHDVLLQPGYFYDFESSGHLVLSLLTKPDVFREGVTRLQHALSETLPIAPGA